MGSSNHDRSVFLARCLSLPLLCCFFPGFCVVAQEVTDFESGLNGWVPLSTESAPVPALSGVEFRGGAQSVRFYTDDNWPRRKTIITKTIDLASDGEISFWGYKPRANMYGKISLFVNGVERLAVLMQPGYPVTTWVEHSANVSAGVNEFEIVFDSDQRNLGDYFYVDDITITGTEPPPPPAPDPEWCENEQIIPRQAYAETFEPTWTGLTYVGAFSGVHRFQVTGQSQFHVRWYQVYSDVTNNEQWSSSSGRVGTGKVFAGHIAIPQRVNGGNCPISYSVFEKNETVTLTFDVLEQYVTDSAIGGGFWADVVAAVATCDAGGDGDINGECDAWIQRWFRHDGIGDGGGDGGDPDT